MSMHFGEGNHSFAVVELRTDTKLAAQVVATQGGLTILLAKGFAVAPGTAMDGRETSLAGGEIHIEIRERE